MASLNASSCTAIFFLLSSKEVTENRAFKGAMKNESTDSLVALPYQRICCRAITPCGCWS